MRQQATTCRADLRPLGAAVNDRVEDLMFGYRRDEPAAVAALAQLRGGAGKSFSDCPELWGLTCDAEDYTESWWGEEEQKHAEEAVHTALSLFALHQQSFRGTPSSGSPPARTCQEKDTLIGKAPREERESWMHQRSRYQGTRRLPDYGLGWAVRKLMPPDEINDSLRKRLIRAGREATIEKRGNQLRQIVTLLRREKIPLDYGLLADQLFIARDPQGLRAVREI